MNTMTLAAACILVSTSAASAQDHDQSHGTHQADVISQALPTEGGQAGFSAIAEIVVLLSDDPTTDWASVNVDALHEHLLDMDLLTTATRAQTELLESGARFTVEAEGRAKEALQRMVSAHAPFLTDATGWIAEAQMTSGGATLTVTTSVETEVPQVQALGFYGLMSTDSHHQAHHLAIAKGRFEH
ncbi:MAG: hypothetical protein JJ908_14180 [Rhizobiales bacterium]|nr:hypothetical protein [Hyphomicrobiales bacterium]MBO6700321.1 hypothetical protein [Hyphomicrobiales bacterium]MBO6737514.1 hypothetical protein [Hyphomicrobiales bacterium]MBO6913429.1 hypothetical protein [Hyphomicrobiales bacterium]MBO6955360.1 hypothetical protein [Hyphomicrobiales bacterium]